LQGALLCQLDVKAIVSGWFFGSEAFRQELLAHMNAELSITEADFSHFDTRKYSFSLLIFRFADTNPGKF